MSGKTQELMPRGHEEVVKAECDNVRFVTVLVLFDNGRDLLVVSNQREEILNMNNHSSYYRRWQWKMCANNVMNKQMTNINLDITAIDLEFFALKTVSGHSPTVSSKSSVQNKIFQDVIKRLLFHMYNHTPNYCEIIFYECQQKTPVSHPVRNMHLPNRRSCWCMGGNQARKIVERQTS